MPLQQQYCNGIKKSREENVPFGSERYAPLPRVEIRNGAYNGQKPMKPVNRKIPATMPRIIAAVPVIWPVR